MRIRIISPADSPLSYRFVLEPVNSPQKSYAGPNTARYHYIIEVLTPVQRTQFFYTHQTSRSIWVKCRCAASGTQHSAESTCAVWCTLSHHPQNWVHFCQMLSTWTGSTSAASLHFNARAPLPYIPRASAFVRYLYISVCFIKQLWVSPHPLSQCFLTIIISL